MQVRSSIQLVRVNSQKATCSSEDNGVLLGGGPVVGSRNNAKVWFYMDLCSYVVAGQLDSSKNYKFGSYLPTAHMQQGDTDVLVDISISLHSYIVQAFKVASTVTLIRIRLCGPLSSI